jgi:two-component system phosphate regulon sensor histidine kinase PhoR
MIRSRKILILVTFLFIGSVLCFYPSNREGIREWALFFLIFFATSLGFFLFFRSTLRKNQPKQKNKEAHEIFDALPQGVVLVSAKGKILYLNEKAEHAFELLKGDIIGEALQKIPSSPLIEKCLYLLKRCQKTGIEQTFSFYMKGENQRSLDLVIKPLPQKSRFLLLFQDTSGQYQIHQLGKDFIANASHELRTPITIIKGFAETLSEMPEVSEEMFQDFTEKILRNCQRMDQLIKNLLTLTDLDYLPEARLQECDLVALADNCIYTLLAVHPDINIQALQNKESVSILADPDLLELAIMNLLENGVKYSSFPADLTITIEDREDEVCLSMTDQGVGIPEEDLPHVFNRFYTVNKSHSRRLGGAGLGLSIVKMIIQKHSGTIEVISEVGKGTTFSLTFQKAKEQELYS